MNTPNILYELFKTQPSEVELLLKLSDEIKNHGVDPENSLFPINRSVEDLCYMVVTIIMPKYRSFLKSSVSKGEVFDPDQTKHNYNIVLSEHQKSNFPFEWHYDLEGKKVTRRFWESVMC